MLYKYTNIWILHFYSGFTLSLLGRRCVYLWQVCEHLLAFSCSFYAFPFFCHFTFLQIKYMFKQKSYCSFIMFFFFFIASEASLFFIPAHIIVMTETYITVNLKSPHCTSVCTYTTDGGIVLESKVKGVFFI